MFREAAEKNGLANVSSASYTYKLGRNNSRAIDRMIKEKLELEGDDFHMSKHELEHI